MIKVRCACILTVYNCYIFQHNKNVSTHRSIYTNLLNYSEVDQNQISSLGILISINAN